MAKLSTSELKGILSSARSSALGADTSSELSAERSRALDYYYGDVSKDMPSLDGRSAAVSNDVADTIEGLMPSLMDIFAGGDEVVKFEPTGPEDVEGAEQETDYINHVFLQKNDGFLVLYNFIKDALLSKNGFVKIFWDTSEDEEEQSYLDQPEDAFALIAQAAQEGSIEIVAHTARDDGLHDVTIKTTKKYECAKVEGVPPEEFGIDRNARAIKDANYCFHQVLKTQADLIEQGYDEAQIKTLPSYASGDGTESQARDTVEESTGSSGGDEGINRAARLIRVTEHYIRMDYDRSGKVKIYRVTTGGEESEVLKREGVPDVEPVDMIPFASMTPIIVPHRFIGRSVADLVIQIMQIKTALIRGQLDNLYMHVNPRPTVYKDLSIDETLDDVLTSRHGALIRARAPGAVEWQKTPDITGSIYPALDYFDQRLELATGVTKQGQGLDAKALQNQSATAVNQAFTMAQARMRLIARIFAETGIKDLFSLLHATIRKHGSQAQTVRLRNKWVKVDPRDWKARNDMTIHVGLGSGGKAEQLAELQILITAQEKGIAAGIVSKKNLFNSAKKLVRALGEKDVDTYFTTPGQQVQPGQQPDPNEQPIEPPEDPAMAKVKADAERGQAELQLKQADQQQRGQELQIKAQLDQMADERKAQIEQVQAQADIETQNRKTAAEMAMAERKFELERELKLLDHQLKREQHQADMEMKRELHQHTLAQSQFGLVAGAQAHEQKMEQARAKPQKGAE